MEDRRLATLDSEKPIAMVDKAKTNMLDRLNINDK